MDSKILEHPEAFVSISKNHFQELAGLKLLNGRKTSTCHGQ